MMRPLLTVAAALLLSGCSLAGWMDGVTPPPPVTIVETTRVPPQVPSECWVEGDPAPPAWVERDEAIDTRLSDEMRREDVNKERSQGYARAIGKRRRVCSVALRVLVAR